MTQIPDPDYKEWRKAMDDFMKIFDEDDPEVEIKKSNQL